MPSDPLASHRVLAFSSALAAGLAVAVVTAVFLPDQSPAWPGNAVQLLATLLIALALEGRVFDMYASRQRLPRREANLGRALIGSVFAAVIYSVLHASQGESFSRVDGALVNVVVVALAIVVLFFAVPPPRSSEG